ncbi:MAG: hypothetical protein ACREL3_13490 [Gemmatimonadales bacterium]
MSERWRKVVSVDLRSLAFFRIVLGSYLLADLVARLDVVSDFYTDDGFLPRDGRILLAKAPWLLSLHMSSGNMLIVAIYFLLAIVFALGMIAGHRTRLCTIGSWILFTSMHARNPFVDGLADEVCIALLFWAMFVPLGARWSLDSAQDSRNARVPNPCSSWGIEALMLQVCLIYWFALALEWEALVPSGAPAAVALFLAVGPVLVFSPIGTDAVRLAVVAAFLGFHLTAGHLLHDRRLSLVCAAAWTIFLPGIVWDYLEERFAKRAPVREGTQRLRHALKAAKARFAWMPRLISGEAPNMPMGPTASTLVVAAMLVTLAGNVSNTRSGRFELPAGMQAVATMAQLGQPWSPWASGTPAENGWYVIEGVLLNGRRADVWSGEAINYAKPADMAGVYHNDRFHRYLIRLSTPEMAGYRPYYADYLCHKWNARYTGKARLEQIYMSYMHEPAPMRGEPRAGIVKELLLHQVCPK